MSCHISVELERFCSNFIFGVCFVRDLGRTLVLFVTMFYLICYNLLVSVVVYPLFGEIAQALPGVSLK